MNKRLTQIFIALVIMLTLAGCMSNKTEVEQKPVQSDMGNTAEKDLPEDPTINPDNAQFWRSTLQKYRKDPDVREILLVRYTGGCGAKAQFYEKSQYNDAWELKLESDVYVGKHGIGKTGEGDSKSPTADFGVRRAFGILPNPGSKLDYLDITETTYACDEEGEYYNQIIDSKETGHECSGEDMYTYSPEYNYGIETDYNSENKYPNGSAIFLHCKGAKAFTGGCVAFDQEDMEYLLQHAEPGMRVVIGED